jgi:tetratricopeptide (TPR) repeat protein
MGRLDAALAAYDESLQQHPEDVVAKSGRAEALKAMGRLDAALAAYDESLQQHPEDVVARSGRAEVLKAMGRFDAALAAYDESLQQHPENTFARNGRAEVLKAMGRFDAALAAYEGALQQHPEDVVARSGRAEVLKAMGRFDAALAAYEELISQQPFNEVARNGRAVILAFQGRSDEALAALPTTMQAVTLQDWIANHIRGMILLRVGRKEEAGHIFRYGVRKCPWASARDYFRHAAAVSRIVQRQFKSARTILADVETHELPEISAILRLHVHGQLGNIAEAQLAANDLGTVRVARVARLRDELTRQFISRADPLFDDVWVAQEEMDLLQLAA